MNNKEADESLTKAVMEKAKERTVALVNGKVFPVSLPPMFYDSYRVIGSEIWWMKPLSKDKEDESYVVYKGKLQAVD